MRLLVDASRRSIVTWVARWLRYAVGMSPKVFAAFVAFTVLATALALIVVLSARRTKLGLGRLFLAVATTGAMVVATTVLGRVGRVHFGLLSVLQLVWLSAVFVAPATGVAVLAQGRSGRSVSRAARFVSLLSLAMVPVAVLTMWIEPRRLQFETARLTARVPLASPLRIGVLADLQCSRITAHEWAAVHRLMAETPDVIVIAGDFFQGTDAHFERTKADFVELLRSLSAPGGVWVVRGDVDNAPAPPTYFEQITAEAGVRVLVDDVAYLEVRGQMVELYGFDRFEQDWDGLVRFLRTPRRPGAARLVLSHWPDVVSLFEEGMDVDLFVAGHTHGGQVVVPFFGPLLTYSSVPRAVAAGGLHTVNGAPIYVSRGVGMERGHAPRLRFLCPPEVAIVTLVGG